MADIDSELVRLVMRIGYSAAWKGLFSDALTIFRGVNGVRPDSEVPIIGAAVVGMLSGDYENAEDNLNMVLENKPDCDLARAHLGCLWRLKGEEEEGMRILDWVCEKTSDPDARSLAERLRSLPVDELLPSTGNPRPAPPGV